MDLFNSKIIQSINKVKTALSDFYLRIFGIARKVFKLKNSKADNSQERINLDKKLIFSLSKSRIPKLKQLKYFKRFLSKREIWLINLCFLIILANSVFLAVKFYKSHLRVVPIPGGEYVEGLIGAPKYINPLYANVSDVDNDITNLIFSSIFKQGKNGELVRDLAESYEISEDGKIYTFKIKQGINWHNGAKLTVDDIVFTFNCIKNKKYQSTWRASFTGVEIEKIDEKTIKFILSEPYAAFLNLLTFGILPQELWQQIAADTASLAELNLRPIGSGAFKFKVLIKDKSGNIRSYGLVRNENYYGQAPYLDELIFKFFPGFKEAAVSLNEGLIDGISYLPRQIKDEIAAQDTLNYYQLNLPQLTAIFLNQNANLNISDKKVRQALAMAIDKNKIVNQILSNGEARLIDSPILPDSFAYNQEIKKYKYNIEEAAGLLDEAGWEVVELTEDDISKIEQDISGEDVEEEIKKQAPLDTKNLTGQAEVKLSLGAGQWRSKDDKFLIVKLTAVDNEENAQVAKAISEFWQVINIKTEVKLIPANQIQNEIIKPRNFTALLYSEIVGADPDPYPFWHSSQIGADGLNITDYANKDVDALLEDARLTSNIETRKEKYKKFQEIIAEEAPAIFLYSPTYTYVQAKKVKGFDVRNILIPRDRFANISEWYIKTGKKLIWN